MKANKQIDKGLKYMLTREFDFKAQRDKKQERLQKPFFRNARIVIYAKGTLAFIAIGGKYS